MRVYYSLLGKTCTRLRYLWCKIVAVSKYSAEGLFLGKRPFMKPSQMLSFLKTNISLRIFYRIPKLDPLGCLFLGRSLWSFHGFSFLGSQYECFRCYYSNKETNPQGASSEMKPSLGEVSKFETHYKGEFHIWKYLMEGFPFVTDYGKSFGDSTSWR